MPSDDAAPPSPARLLGLTAEIVAAHASRTPVSTDQLPELIRAVHRALAGLGQATAEAAPPEPAVPIRRSVQHDRIVCLECGARMAMLKRHLATAHGLTPEAYRERWGLPRDYPMTAPDYAEVRSGLARRFGLGRKRGGQAEAAAPLVSDSAVAELQTAVAGAETAASAVKRRSRKRDASLEDEAPAETAAPGTSAPARGRGRRRARDTGAG